MPKCLGIGRKHLSGFEVKMRSLPHTKKFLGNLGERIVERLLVDKGLLTIQRNYRGPGFELDLIMYERNENTYFLIEVKLRQTLKRLEELTLSHVETLVSQHKLSCLRHGLNEFSSRFNCAQNASFSMKLALVTLCTHEKTVQINFFDLDG